MKTSKSTVNTTHIHCRIDTKVKADAAKVFQALGLNLSDAIRLFLIRIATDGTIPFNLCVPNAKTIAAMKEIEKPKTRIKLR